MTAIEMHSTNDAAGAPAKQLLENLRLEGFVAR